MSPLPPRNKKCANFEFCENYVPVAHSSKKEHDHHAFCITCGSWASNEYSFQWDKLTIENTREGEECSICLEPKKRMMFFPTNCGHRFCLECSRNLLFWDDAYCFIPPSKFGGPKQCDTCTPNKPRSHCDLFLARLEQWREAMPEDYDRWRQAMQTVKQNTSYGSCTCPLCRKKYTPLTPQDDNLCCAFFFQCIGGWIASIAVQWEDNVRATRV